MKITATSNDEYLEIEQVLEDLSDFIGEIEVKAQKVGSEVTSNLAIEIKPDVGIPIIEFDFRIADFASGYDRKKSKERFRKKFFFREITHERVLFSIASDENKKEQDIVLYFKNREWYKER